MSCLIHSRYSMTALIGTQVAVQSVSGEITRTWSYGKSFDLIASGIKSSGIRQVASTEEWGENFEDVEWLKISTGYKMSKSMRLKDITNSAGVVIWPGEFDVKGVTPVVDPFGNVVEYDVLAKRADVQ